MVQTASIFNVGFNERRKQPNAARNEFGRAVMTECSTSSGESYDDALHRNKPEPTNFSKR